MASFIPTSHITPTAKIYPVAGDTHKKIQLCICFLSNDKQKLTLNYKEKPESKPIHIVSLIIEKDFDPNNKQFLNLRELYNILNTIEQNFSEFQMNEKYDIKNIKPLSQERIRSIFRLSNLNNLNDLQQKIKTLIGDINSNADISESSSFNKSVAQSVSSSAAESKGQPIIPSQLQSQPVIQSESQSQSQSQSVSPSQTQSQSQSQPVIQSESQSESQSQFVPPSVTPSQTPVISNPNNKYLLKPGNLFYFNTNYSQVNTTENFVEYVIESYNPNEGTVTIKNKNKNKSSDEKPLILKYNDFINNIKLEYYDQYGKTREQSGIHIDQIQIALETNITKDQFEKMKTTYYPNFILFDSKIENPDSAYKYETKKFTYYPIFIGDNNNLHYYNKNKEKEPKPDAYNIYVCKILPDSEANKIQNFLQHLNQSSHGGNANAKISSRKDKKSYNKLKHSTFKKHRNNRRKHARKTKRT